MPFFAHECFLKVCFCDWTSSYGLCDELFFSDNFHCFYEFSSSRFVCTLAPFRQLAKILAPDLRTPSKLCGPTCTVQGPESSWLLFQGGFELLQSQCRLIRCK